MIELKEWTASEIEEYDDARLELAEDGKIDCTRVYIKEDVDKVIAELKEKLKEQTSIAEEGWKEFRTYHTSYAEAVKELYDKNKEIVELKENHKTEVKELLCLIRDKENNFNRAFDSEEKEIRHQKYKRCLAMALLWLDRAENSTDLENELVSRKRCSKWMELAEKFNEDDNGLG